MASAPSRTPAPPPAAEVEAVVLAPTDIERLHYLFDMLAELRRVSLAGDHKFLGYLIEMAANESSRMLKGASAPPKRRGPKSSDAA